VPLASVPTQIAGRNRVLRRMVLDSIRGDPEWKNGGYQAQPRQGLTAALHILMLMTSSPLQWQKTAPTRDQADAFLAEQSPGRSRRRRACRWRRWRPAGAQGHEPQAHREERGALRCPEALVEVDLRDVLSHQGADRDPGEGVHDAGEDEERREAPEPLQ